MTQDGPASVLGLPPQHPLGSVVVPAHQEAGRIGLLLQGLADGWVPGELDLVVVSNGSTDGTAEVARDAAQRLGMRIRVLDLLQPGKAAAVRAGEGVTRAPRLYLDADVRCSAAAARALVAAVATSASPTTGGAGARTAHVAVPTREYDLTGCTAPARLYHRTVASLPWVRQQLSGRGAYALSEHAAAEFAAAGEVVADDRLATELVPREDAVVVPEVVVVVPARTVRDVVAVRSRIYSGNSALADSHGVARHDHGTARRLSMLLPLLRSPARWPGLVVWAAVTVLAKRRGRAGRRVGWSRTTTGATPPRGRTDLRSLLVVVVTYRSESTVEACLRALEDAAACCDADVTVAVVDNASDDATLRAVRRAGEGSLLVTRGKNDGFGRACAAGAATAGSDALLFCNPDVVVEPTALSALLAEAATHPGAAVVGGRQLPDVAARERRSWWRGPTWWSMVCFATGMSSAFPRSRLLDPEEGGRWDGTSRPVGVVSGGLMLVRREAWDALDGFDPDMLLYGEDADLCLRARRGGWDVRVCGAATYHHDVGASTRTSTSSAVVDSAVRQQLVLRGRAAVLRRHLGAAAVRLLVAGVGLRALGAPASSRTSAGRASTGRTVWRAAWSSRRAWSRGWQPGDRLDEVVEACRGAASAVAERAVGNDAT